MSKRHDQVVKANALIEASYRLTLSETRLVLSAIAQVRRDEEPTDAVMYEVRANALADISGIAARDAYEQLSDAAERLKKREVRLYEGPQGERKPQVTVTNWVQTSKHIPDEGRVELRFSRDILPYLSELRDRYTRYELRNVAGMRSSYGVRLYELLQQWRQHGEREIEVEDFRRLFGLTDQYKALKDLKRRVLKPAVDDINNHSDLRVTWGQRQAGRRVAAFQFQFKPKHPEKQAKGQGKGQKGVGKGGQEPTNQELRAAAKPGESWEEVADRKRRERGQPTKYT